MLACFQITLYSVQTYHFHTKGGFHVETDDDGDIRKDHYGVQSKGRLRQDDHFYGACW